MGKQKVVIGISMKDQKARTKAFKIAVSISGVDSASIQAEKGQLEVIGEIDPVSLANQLRKGLGQAELVSVDSAEKKEDKKEEKKAAETPAPQTMTVTYYDPSHIYYPYYTYPVPQYQQQPGCSIM